MSFYICISRCVISMVLAEEWSKLTLLLFSFAYKNVWSWVH